MEERRYIWGKRDIKRKRKTGSFCRAMPLRYTRCWIFCCCMPCFCLFHFSAMPPPFTHKSARATMRYAAEERYAVTQQPRRLIARFFDYQFFIFIWMAQRTLPPLRLFLEYVASPCHITLAQNDKYWLATAIKIFRLICRARMLARARHAMP